MVYLKRYAIPKFWPLPKKEKIFAVSPRGPHKKEFCIPLQIVLRDILKYVESGKEAKKVLKQGKVLVDKKGRKDPKFGVGLMDVIEMPAIKKYFRVLVDKKGLILKEINAKEASKKLCRIKNKTTIKGGVQQLNLHDGRSILVEKNDYKPDDSVLISLPEQKIIKHFKLDKGMQAIIVGGSNIGVKGKIKSVYNRKTMLEKSKVVLETKKGDIETLKDYLLVGKIE